MEIYLVARWSDGSVSHEAMQIVGRFPAQPTERGWRAAGDGTWVRASSDANCIEYLARVAQRRLELDNITMTGWRRLADDEHRMFERDREYRDAMEDAGGRIGHNMPKARELHRSRLRHINGDRFLRLDREWVNASASGNAAEARDVENKRKALRDMVDDPRIEAAQTLDDLKAVMPPPEE